MAFEAIGVTLGSPNVSGQVPTTDSNIAAPIAQAVTDTATLATNLATAQTSSTIADTDANTSTSNVSAAVTDFNTACGTGTNGLANLLSVTYSGSPPQIGTATNSATLTSTQQNAVIALLNTALAALATANTSSAATLVAVNGTNGEVQALSTTAIAADLALAQAELTNENVFIQFDSSVVTNVATLNNTLVSALAFVRDTGILPL